MQYVEELAVSDAPLKSTIFACCMSAQTQPTSLQLPTGPQSITRTARAGFVVPTMGGGTARRVHRSHTSSTRTHASTVSLDTSDALHPHGGPNPPHQREASHLPRVCCESNQH